MRHSLIVPSLLLVAGLVGCGGSPDTRATTAGDGGAPPAGAGSATVASVAVAPAPAPAPVAKAEAAGSNNASLIDATDPGKGWTFGNGAEFPGAVGSLAADPAVTHNGHASLHLISDLTKGGNYVQMARDVSDQNLALDTLSFWIHAPGVPGMAMRLIDGSDQCHQISLTFDAASDDGSGWRLVTFPVDRFFAARGTADAVKGIAKYENWGGANDGKWHGNLKAMVLVLGVPGQRSEAWVSDLVATTRAGTRAWASDFEGATGAPAGWTTEGDAQVRATAAFQGANALVLARSAADREKPCSATGPTFPVAPGTWEADCAVAVDLESPDASFKGTVAVEMLDAGGAVVDTATVADPFGKHPWELKKVRFKVPHRAVAARVVTRLEKTVGTFQVDALTVTPIDTGHKDSAVDRIVFAASELGNIFTPGNPRTFTITVESTRELVDSERVVTWAVADYWGAEQGPAATVSVVAAGKHDDRFKYEATVDLSVLPLEVGRYYEIRAQVPLSDNDPFRNWSSFAILPQPATKEFKPEQIPFTARDWDNRIPEYLRLADRVGIRIGGIWGGWPATAPYTPDAPTIGVCEELHMGVLTGFESSKIEHHDAGYEQYTDEVLRKGVDAWLAKFGQDKPLYVDLGNEPNNTGDRLKEAVHAYKVVYDEIKKVDPSVTVIGTSIGATEEYFQDGFQDACDVYDFHVYESPQNVRDAIHNYQEMAKKYHAEKPIWSTETGLNSQGMTRQYISGDMIRKFAAFFAAGGANISWFDFLYPDPDGKALGSGGDSFNVFDSRYSTYAARIDAVALYNLINGICVKKFVEERTWNDDLHGCLFRDADGHCFTILYKDKGRADVELMLPVHDVTVIHIDGRRSALDAGGDGIALTVSEDPVLLEYDGPATLPGKLADPVVAIASAPARLVRGVPGTITVATKGDPKAVSLIAPPGWTVARDAANPLAFNVTSPEESAVREGDLLVRLADDHGKVAGEANVRPIVTGRLEVEIRPSPAPAGGKPGALVVVRNRSSQPQAVTWTFALTGERPTVHGDYVAPQKTAAYLADAGNGSLQVPANGEATVRVPLANIDPVTVYLASASITDATGGTLTTDRAIAGFVAVPRASGITIDGSLDEPAWQAATPCLMDEERQYLRAAGDAAPVWKGKADLSATMKFLWDDQAFYVGVDATDDVFANTQKDGMIWAGDGLQFLIDPMREATEKAGKYDLGMALGTKGPQAWCWLSASSNTTPGEITGLVKLAIKRGANGNATYEMAIPWANLAPFKAAPGADLGLTMIYNEDDGGGRKSFIGWFGSPHTKHVDTVGDLILQP